MKPNIPFMILALACGAAATVAIAAVPAPAGTANDPFWTHVHWDDDDDDDHINQRAAVPMPVPDAEAIRRAGMAVVHEVERDDGLIEVEGLDASGRKLDLKMDAQGKRVISVRHDD